MQYLSKPLKLVPANNTNLKVYRSGRMPPVYSLLELCTLPNERLVEVMVYSYSAGLFVRSDLLQACMPVASLSRLSCIIMYTM